MNNKKRQQKNMLSSLLKQREQPTHLKKQLREDEEKYKLLQEEYNKLNKDFSDIEKQLREDKEKYQLLCDENEKAKKKLSCMEAKGVIEKFLKNEAYAFLLSEGLLDKFLLFREPKNRTKTQDAIYTLISATDLVGMWIDL